MTAIETRAVWPRPLLPHGLSDRKEEILDGLEEIILEEGFRALRLTDLAKRLSTSYTTLYQLAPTKEELVMLVIDRWYQRAGTTVQEKFQASEDPVDRFNIWIEAGVSGSAATSSSFWLDVASHAGVAQLVASYNRYYLKVLEALIDAGVAAGAFRPLDARMVAFTWEAVSARLQHPDGLNSLEGRSLRQVSERWVDLMLHGILREG